MRILALVALIDAVDRGILPGVLTKVQDDFGFSDTAAGFLGTAFVLTGFLVTLPAGYLADRGVRTRIIAGVLVSWGAISAMNAAVRSYWQFLAVRATLGIGETIDNPASSSLVADYYRAEIRGQAFARLRAAPLVGQAIGIALGGAVGELFGWRWAFLLVGVPGSLLAVAVWRLPEPARGDSDDDALDERGERVGPYALVAERGGRGTDVGDVVDEFAINLPPSAPDASHRGEGWRALLADVRLAAGVPSLRALVIGSAIGTGALTGVGFWAAAFYERHAGMDADQSAGVAGGLILAGALVGTIVGGRLADRLRRRYAGAPMLVAGVSSALGATLLAATFLPVPLWFRLPVQVVGVALIVGGLPALASMISEVVPATLRGTAYSVAGFLAAVAGAISPPLIGFIADQFAVTVDGEREGHLANAFLCVMPLVVIGAGVVLRGRRWVEGDVAAVRAAAVPGGA